MEDNRLTRFFAIVSMADGMSKLFRMMLIGTLFTALVVTSMVSCSRGSQLADLRVVHEGLQSDHRHLTIAHNALLKKYNELNDKFTYIAEEYKHLSGEYIALSEAKEHITNEYKHLANEYETIRGDVLYMEHTCVLDKTRTYYSMVLGR